jgi:DNA (cytosine-5)-methyltransferase 1
VTYASLFSGIGGFDLGFDRAGMECVLQVEQDKNCLNILERHWPKVKRVNDVRKVKRVSADLVCGGFPCQDVSVAGKRAGLAGERSGLWFEFHRIVERSLPRWVVVENVPGLLSSNGGRDFAAILRGLVECGYGVAWRVLDAQYFGLAQRRRRVFVVASLGSGRAAEVLFERESGAWDSPTGREAGQRLATDVAASPRGVGGGSRGWTGDAEQGLATIAFTERTRKEGRTFEAQEEIAYALTNPGSGGRTHSRMIAFGGNNTKGEIDIATAQNAHGGTGRIDFESETFVVGALNAHDKRHGHAMTTQQAAECGQLIVGTLNSGGNDGGFRTEPGEHIIVFDLAQITSNVNRTRVDPSLPASTLNQAGQMHAAGAMGVRRLTPVECERLQGFPDDWTDGQSDSVRYRQLGNAVAVPCAEWIGRRIMEMDK